jgi:hypothetical protein
MRNRTTQGRLDNQAPPNTSRRTTVVCISAAFVVALAIVGQYFYAIAQNPLP